MQYIFSFWYAQSSKKKRHTRDLVFALPKANSLFEADCVTRVYDRNGFYSLSYNKLLVFRACSAVLQ